MPSAAPPARRQGAFAPEHDLAARLGGRTLYVASHRGPVRYRFHDGHLEASPAAGGLRLGYRPVNAAFAQAIAVADGMNLVAKEGMIVGEREPVLVLSSGCGAHAQLGGDALSISPDDVEGTAAALERALEMPWAERRRRAAALRACIEREDLARWAARQFDDLLEEGSDG